MTDILVNPASYKDPAGYVFEHNGRIYRKVNKVYASFYDQLMQSGLYACLSQKKWLLSHTETDQTFDLSTDFYKILSVQKLPFISYPYEWSFEMLKDAALLTLDINKAAIEHGMILKDATPFNIQFYQGKPVFIDTLSFETYEPFRPWVAYKQFCETFLFPLYLEYYLNTDIKKMLSAYIDGIPVQIIAGWLPVRSRFNLGVWLHVHVQHTVARKSQKEGSSTFDKAKMLRLVGHLNQVITGLNRPGTVSTWTNYYHETILSKEYLAEKEKLFRSFISNTDYTRALDVGANDGYFSAILAENAAEVIGVDSDSPCINRLYQQIKRQKRINILPLVVDISNPSPAVGLNNTERLSFLQRSSFDLVAVLALTHHLVFTRKIKPVLLPELFGKLTEKWLIIEFVPPEDPKVQELMQHKNGLHAPYDIPSFENDFSALFEIERKAIIPGCTRVLYLMKKRG